MASTNTTNNTNTNTNNNNNMNHNNNNHNTTTNNNINNNRHYYQQNQNAQQQQQQQHGHHQQAHHPHHHQQQQQQQHHHPQQQQHHHQQHHQQQKPKQNDTNNNNTINNNNNNATNNANSSTTTITSEIDLSAFENIDYPYCSDVSKYEKLTKIGQGTFGEVHKSRLKPQHQQTTTDGSTKPPETYYALKKVLTDGEKEGFPITALREIKILQVLNHENIVKLVEICTSKPTAQNKFKSQFYLVFEFCEHDLAGLLSNSNVKFTLSEMKKVMQQLLNGLYFIHKNSILHRDMKTANILVNRHGILKLADFGLARAIDINQKNKYTNRVVTLWYRPPELLLGERYYGPSIDMWGAGCIMAELWTRSPIMQGNNEQHQLELITQLCGSIDTKVWPSVDELELFNRMNLRQGQKRRLKERIQAYIKDQYALDLLDRLLTLDPKQRIDSDDALNHDFFWTEPLPTNLNLDKYQRSMFEYTVPPRRSQARPAPANKPNEQHFDRVY